MVRMSETNYGKASRPSHIDEEPRWSACPGCSLSTMRGAAGARMRCDVQSLYCAAFVVWMTSRHDVPAKVCVNVAHMLSRGNRYVQSHPFCCVSV